LNDESDDLTGEGPLYETIVVGKREYEKQGAENQEYEGQDTLFEALQESWLYGHYGPVGAWGADVSGFSTWYDALLNAQNLARNMMSRTSPIPQVNLPPQIEMPEAEPIEAATVIIDPAEREKRLGRPNVPPRQSRKSHRRKGHKKSITILPRKDEDFPPLYIDEPPVITPPPPPPPTSDPLHDLFTWHQRLSAGEGIALMLGGAAIAATSGILGYGFGRAKNFASADLPDSIVTDPTGLHTAFVLMDLLKLGIGWQGIALIGCFAGGFLIGTGMIAAIRETTGWDPTDLAWDLYGWTVDPSKEPIDGYLLSDIAWDLYGWAFDSDKEPLGGYFLSDLAWDLFGGYIEGSE
jgi:hypothetical protein